jgi:hypothetical protein
MFWGFHHRGGGFGVGVHPPSPPRLREKLGKVLLHAMHDLQQRLGVTDLSYKNWITVDEHIT